jgi:hypothetical protein
VCFVCAKGKKKERENENERRSEDECGTKLLNLTYQAIVQVPDAQHLAVLEGTHVNQACTPDAVDHLQ